MELTFEKVMCLAALGCTPVALEAARRAKSYELAVGQLEDLKKNARHAYKHYAREYHPDVNKSPGAEDTFKLLADVYELVQKMQILRPPEHLLPSHLFVRRATWSTNQGSASTTRSTVSGSGSFWG